MCGIKRHPQASAKIRPICKQVSHLEVENSKKIINFYGVSSYEISNHLDTFLSKIKFVICSRQFFA